MRVPKTARFRRRRGHVTIPCYLCTVSAPCSGYGRSRSICAILLDFIPQGERDGFRFAALDDRLHLSRRIGRGALNWKEKRPREVQRE